MALTREDFSDKTLSGREATSSSKRLIEELGASTLTVHAQTVYGEAFDTVPATELAKAAPKVAVSTLFALTVDPSVASSQAWKAGTVDWVPPEFGAGYEILFFDGSDVSIGVPTQISKGFRFNYKTGILTLDDSSGITFPIKVTGYRYVGATVADLRSLNGATVADKAALRALDQNVLAVSDEVKVNDEGTYWRFLGGDPDLEASWKLARGEGKPTFVAGNAGTDARIYVAHVTGDDFLGDGSSGNPYKRVDRAIADIPLIELVPNLDDYWAFNLPTYSIRFAEGGTDYVMELDEDWDLSGRMGSFMEIVGFQDQVQVIPQADAAALVAVTNKVAIAESTVTGGVTPVVGDTDHFVLYNYDALSFGYPVDDYYWGAALKTSGDPANELQLVAQATGSFAPFGWKDHAGQNINVNSFAGGTRIRSSTGNFQIVLGSGVFGPSGINTSGYIMGIEFVDNTIIKGQWNGFANKFSGICTFRSDDGSTTNLGAVSTSSCFVGKVTVSSTAGRLSGLFVAGISVISHLVEFGGLNTAILRGANPFVVGDRVAAPSSGFNSAIDFEGSGVCLTVDGSRVRFSGFIAGISIAAGHTRAATVREGGYLDAASMTIPAASGQGTSLEPYEANSRGQVSGISSPTNRPVNTTTPGNDVKLGTTITNYASLPVADALQLSRAE